MLLNFYYLLIVDNQDTIDLIDSKPTGILALLDSACLTPQGSDETFTSTLFSIYSSHPRLKRIQSVKSKTSGRYDGGKIIEI